LQPSNCGDAQFGHGVRVLRVHFFDSSIPGIAAQVEHGREYERVPQSTRLHSNSGKHLLEEVAVPCAAQGYGLWERGGSFDDRAVQSLAMEHDRYPQPSILEHPRLKKISALGAGTSAVWAWAQTGELIQESESPQSVRERLLNQWLVQALFVA